MHPDVRTPGSPLPMTPSRARGSAALDFPGLPILLRPALRAYVLGYASAVGPRLLTLLLQHISRRRKKRLQQQEDDQNKESFVDGLARIIRTGLEPQRFPAFCAALIGGNSLLLVRWPCPFPCNCQVRHKEPSSHFLTSWSRSPPPSCTSIVSSLYGT